MRIYFPRFFNIIRETFVADSYSISIYFGSCYTLMNDVTSQNGQTHIKKSCSINRKDFKVRLNTIRRYILNG